jgi:3-(3-hydroxy-phenyl)propionate hydroxylase
MTAGATDYQKLQFAYTRSADQSVTPPVRHSVVVAGAGPVGLVTAIDLAQSGVPVVLLDDDDRLSTGSRAICFAKRTLEIADRLGVGQRMVDKGVTWNTGKVFLRDELLYSFDLLPERGHRRPAFINLQQYYVEGYLLDRARELPNLEIRWKNKITHVRNSADGVRLDIETPDDAYQLECAWLIAADGGRSAVRRSMGLESKGQTFRDRFLIADVRMTAAFPAERWFWFDPPFHPKQSVLLHQQPDNVWRIDFQLGWDADPDVEKQPERVIPRVQALLGNDAKFELEWVSIYTFGCQRMDKFRHGRVLFAGDSAHGVSPFGARGANSGVQDADNLAWKLRMVLDGAAPDALLDSYDSERVFAADENILNSTRSTDFITPKSDASRAFRDATLELARDCNFARRIINSGRLSVPTVYANSPLNTPDDDVFDSTLVPGAPAADAPVQIDGTDAWFLNQWESEFTLAVFLDAQGTDISSLPDVAALANLSVSVKTLLISSSAPPRGLHILHDIAGHLTQRYDGRPGTVYLFRPDQHIAARGRVFDIARIAAALDRALGKSGPPA